MPSILFLQALGLTRDQARNMLNAQGCTHEIIWPNVENEKDQDNVQKQDEVQNRGVEIVVASQHRIGPEELDKFTNLKMVSLAFTGHDEVDKDYCKGRDLLVSYVPAYSTVSVAELTVFMAGALLRKLHGAVAEMHSGNWDTAAEHSVSRARPRELRGRTVGFLGTGAIGMATARLFHAFGCPLIGWSHNPGKHPEFVQLGGTFVPTIEDVFKDADIVSLHLELNEETTHTANAQRLALMRDDSILINTARTYLVDPSALVQWLRANPDKGAALDVTKKEQFENAFVGVNNLLLTPHLGCQTEQASAALARVAISNVGSYLNRRIQNQLLPD